MRWTTLDLVGFTTLLGPTFGLFEDEVVLDKEHLVKVFQRRLDLLAPIRLRVWSDEHAFIGGGTACSSAAPSNRSSVR